ncbi:PAQR family membrane homeostasis protein TrhA [Pistricoccus aurantiacus]|uniref:PAQR family membrane homeostasis protein TrhA n=1 Tax=Pistricoccus aurantiacus TaxID=1883414 RepID=UPI003639532D
MTPSTHSDRHLNSNEYSVVEELWHSISHGIGALLSLVGMVVLIILASLMAPTDAWTLVGVSLYGTTLVLLYSASTLYHAARQPRWKRLFKLLDHCAIYTLIAGTYTPFLLVNLRGSLGWTLFGVVWSLALGGIVLKLIWPQRFGVLRVAIYLIMGWLILVAAGEMSQRLTSITIALLVAGGITYTLGVIFYAIPAIPFHHTIWHFFVLGGSVCHYFAVYTALMR